MVGVVVHASHPSARTPRHAPEGPEPTTATDMPERYCGMRGVIQPSSQARSTMEYSMFLMVTGLSTRPATQLCGGAGCWYE